MRSPVRWLVIVGVVAGVAALAGLLWWSTRPGVVAGDPGGFGGGGRGPVPVEAAAVRHGPMQATQWFTGSLESQAQFTAAPKVGGRIAELSVDLADEVRRGQVVARLDADEYAQALAQAQAELAVARAHLAQATSSVEIADRALERTRTLQERGVASESALDAAISEQLASSAALEVARAEVQQAEAIVSGAQIRLGYATINAVWGGGDERRVVGQVFVEEGDTIAANTPILTVVEIDPIQAVMHVTEGDYARLSPGQPVTLTTDAYPGRTFSGEVARISPVFSAASRQARVEMRIDNGEALLKPGMFARIATVLHRVADAQAVPQEALTRRNERPVVFVLDAEGKRATLQPVEVGISNEGWVQVVEPRLTGEVVTLGLQLLEDGSLVNVVRPGPSDATAGADSQ